MVEHSKASSQANDIELSKELLRFLRASFAGASFGKLKVDECCGAVERALNAAHEDTRRLDFMIRHDGDFLSGVESPLCSIVYYVDGDMRTASGETAREAIDSARAAIAASADGEGK